MRFLLLPSHLHSNCNCEACNKRNISSSLDESAISTQPRANVTGVITIQGNFSSCVLSCVLYWTTLQWSQTVSSYAGKGQRRRWCVNTFESGQRKSATAATVPGDKRALRYIVADAQRQKYEPGFTRKCPSNDCLLHTSTIDV